MTTNAVYTNQLISCLREIDKYNALLSAFVTVNSKQARIQAEDADRAIQAGQKTGLLHGMPIAIKDNIDTAGMLTTSGAAYLANNIPDKDATVIQRLKEAGAIIIGKTTLGELVFDIRSHNPITNVPCNPWSLKHSPGGSSGGSAAAIAANMTIGALGSDTGGSIRIPAAHCGVTGLRPTHGAVPVTGSMAVSHRFDTIGPMARNAIDVAKIFAVITGFDPDYPYSRPHYYPNLLKNLNTGVQGLKIGIPTNYFFDDLPDEFKQAVMAVAQILQAKGAQLVTLNLEGAEQTHPQSSTILYADIAAYHAQTLKNPNAITPMVRERIERGLSITGIQYSNALNFRKTWQSTIEKAFQQVDLILTPTTPIEALPNSNNSSDLHSLTAQAAKFTYAGTLAGIPGISIPCGFSKNGLPIGAMLQAKWWDEELLFRAAIEYQNLTKWHVPHV